MTYFSSLFFFPRISRNLLLQAFAQYICARRKKTNTCQAGTAMPVPGLVTSAQILIIILWHTLNLFNSIYETSIHWPWKYLAFGCGFTTANASPLAEILSASTYKTQNISIVCKLAFVLIFIYRH
jgi:hypothetical protein